MYHICQNCKGAITRDAKNEKRVLALLEEAKAKGEDPFEIRRQRLEQEEEQGRTLAAAGAETSAAGAGRS